MTLTAVDLRPLWAQAAGLVLLSKTSGEAVELSIGTEDWMPVSQGEPLRAGDLVRTGFNTVAILTLPDGSTLTLEPLTTVDFREVLFQRQTNALRLNVVVWAGRAQCDFSRAATGSSFTVRTPIARVLCASGRSSVQHVRDKGTRVVVDVGRTSVASEGGEEFLYGGQTAIVLTKSSVPQVSQTQARVRQPAPRTPSVASPSPAPPSVAAMPSVPPRLTPAPRTSINPTPQTPDTTPPVTPPRLNAPQVTPPPSRGGRIPNVRPPSNGETKLPPPAKATEPQFTLTSEKTARVQRMLANIQTLAVPDMTPEQLDTEIQNVQKSVAANQENVALHQRLAVLHAQRGRKDDLYAAANEFQIVARAKRLTPRGHMLFGQVLARLGRVNEAVKELQTALEWQPDLAQAHEWLAFIYTALEEYDRADEAYEAAIQLEPQSVFYRANYAETLSARGSLDAAIAQYKDAIALRDTSAHLHVRLAGVYLKKGDTEAAIAEYRAALRLQPNHELAHESLVRLLRQAGRAQEAEAEVKRFAREK